MTTATPMNLREAKEKLDGLRFRANRMYNEAGSDLDFTKIQSEAGTTEEKISLWKSLQLEMTEVGAEYDRLRAIDAEMKAASAQYQQSRVPTNTPPLQGGDYQHLGQSGLIRNMLGQSKEYARLSTQRGSASIGSLSGPELKTLITLTTVSPGNQRMAPVNMRLEERTVIDMIGESPVNTATVEWYEETTVTNAAAETAENTAKPEAALAWTLRNTTIKTIAVWIPVTRQALQDNDFLEAQIRNRLIFMVQRREETQVLTGNAVGENLRGIINTSGIQTQAKGADALPTAIMKAMGKIRGSAGSGFIEPDGIVLHPNDYIDLMTLQEAGTGAYLLQAVLQNEPQPRLWGLPIRQTTALTENTGLVGAFAAGAEVFRIGGLSVEASSEHSTYFTENKVAILAETRIGLAVQIPTAFCTVTGI